MGIKARVFKNKANDQFSIMIPRKQLNLKGGKDPKFINIKDYDFEDFVE